MSTSIFIQFDGELSDEDRLLSDLRAAGLDVLSVRRSRWIRMDAASGEEIDAGGRIDVEIRLRAMPEAQPIIDAVADFMASTPLVTP